MRTGEQTSALLTGSFGICNTGASATPGSLFPKEGMHWL